MKFQNLKFDISNNSELSEIIQHMLFELGYTWPSNGKITKYVKNTLYVQSDGTLSFSNICPESKLTTLPELAEMLQEHYESKDVVRVGEVVEAKFPFTTKGVYLLVGTCENTSVLINLRTGNIFRDKTAYCLCDETYIEELESVFEGKILKNYGPLKDLNVRELLGK